MEEIRERLLHVEHQLNEVSSKVQRIDTRVGAMATSIAYIAEKLSKPKILPFLVFVNSLITAVLLAVMFSS